MTDQRPVTPAPAPLEEYAHQFDECFSRLNQRNGFRRYLEGLLLPTMRNKSLEDVRSAAIWFSYGFK
jgi:hypothetical protein